MNRTETMKAVVPVNCDRHWNVSWWKIGYKLYGLLITKLRLNDAHMKLKKQKPNCIKSPAVFPPESYAI